MDFLISKKGDYGTFVGKAQNILTTLNFYKGKTDNDYGTKTEDAVSLFQKSNNISVTGEIDIKTFEKMVININSLKVKPKIAFNKHVESLPWNEATPLPEMNSYIGMVKDSCLIFPKSNLVIWESKFDIDADGSGPKIPGDTYLPDTSLHDKDNKPLNSWELPFGVLPLNRDNGMSMTETGLKLGDLGIAFYKDAACPFIYGDRGPKSKIGEGSAYMAYNLNINYDPVKGGLHNIPPGVVFLSFIGTHKGSSTKKTDYNLTTLWAEAFKLYHQHIKFQPRSFLSSIPTPKSPPYPTKPCE